VTQLRPLLQAGLTSLSLASCAVGEEGASALVHAIVADKVALTSLDFCDNDAEGETEPLARAAQLLSTFCGLDMDGLRAQRRVKRGAAGGAAGGIVVAVKEKIMVSRTVLSSSTPTPTYPCFHLTIPTMAIASRCTVC
jgi:hypothetical protein